jgi:3-phenylpropionate/cinnamic acid dioxygenase small subunit
MTSTDLVTDPRLWMEVHAWLDHEAELLDDGRFEEWLELTTEDIEYEMPVRLTRERGALDSHRGNQYFLDDRATLRLRVERLSTEFAWAEDPPSRTRRFVTNVRVQPDPQGVRARSYLLIFRNRGDDAGQEWLSAERRDLLRRTPEGLRLSRREIRIDQSIVGSRNLAIFL